MKLIAPSLAVLAALSMWGAASAQNRTERAASPPEASRTTATTQERSPRANPRNPVPDEPGHSDTVDTMPGGDARTDRARNNKLSDADIATAPIREIRRVTRHTATIGGRPLAYTATAGTLTIRDDEGKPTASMFYVAYTVPGANRPVTFLYNGGPGSSSMWLHMGSVGPIRVRTDSPQATRNAPYNYTDNNESILDKSDLVFVDAVGAGYSRPVGDTKLEKFWGTDPDIDAFARGIERYLTANQRWNSPKFIFGESYGTTRSAGLSYRLQQDGVQLNGVILLSSILNYGRRDPGFDNDIIGYLPTYAATAAYHSRVPKPADEMAWLREVRAWARGPYAQALAAGQDLPPAQKQAIAEKLAGYTGLSVRYLIEVDLRVEPGRFRKELLRDQRKTIGRYDGRFMGFDVDAAGDSPEYDAADTGPSDAFISTFHDYTSRELGYDTELTYRPSYRGGNLQWDFKHRAPGRGGPGGGTSNADVVLDLSAAMRQNPHLHVFSMNGVYDFATPFFATEYDLNHMQIDPSLRPNLSFAYYPSGHMVYLNEAALKTMKTDLAKFYDEATAR